MSTIRKLMFSCGLKTNIRINGRGDYIEFTLTLWLLIAQPKETPWSLQDNYSQKILDVRQAWREVTVETTAYTIGDDYTPSTIMANGEVPHLGACAYNRVPLGTTLEIDGEQYVVKDRAADDDVVDIYMGSIEECLEYGRKVKTIKIMEE